MMFFSSQRLKIPCGYLLIGMPLQLVPYPSTSLPIIVAEVTRSTRTVTSLPIWL